MIATEAIAEMDTSGRYPSGWPRVDGYVRVRVFWLSDSIVMVGTAPTVWPDRPHLVYDGPSVANGMQYWAPKWYWSWAISHGPYPSPEQVIYVAHHPREGCHAEVFLEARFGKVSQSDDGTWRFSEPGWTPRKRGYIEGMISGKLT